jgi:prevent-host-death family protein
MTCWQVQDAKQRFSELVQRTLDEGPQVVTRRGQEVVVVIAVREYRRLTGEGADFKAFLADAPDLSLLQLDDRPRDLPREVEL